MLKVSIVPPEQKQTTVRNVPRGNRLRWDNGFVYLQTKQGPVCIDDNGLVGVFIAETCRDEPCIDLGPFNAEQPKQKDLGLVKDLPVMTIFNAAGWDHIHLRTYDGVLQLTGGPATIGYHTSSSLGNLRVTAIHGTLKVEAE